MGDICNFVTAVSALSNTSQRSVYNLARRPILRTGLRAVQLFLVFNMSFVNGIAPYQLKISKVIPVYKKGNRNSVGNIDPFCCYTSLKKSLRHCRCTRDYDY